MYVDDISLMFVSIDFDYINYCFNYDLSNVYEWLSVNKFILNMIKIEFMFIVLR